MNRKSRLIAFSAVIVALIVVLAPLPFVFLVPVLTVIVLFNWKMSLIASLAFGVVSLLYSFIGGGSPVSAAFIAAPWIPIVPRIFVGLGAKGAFVLINKLVHSESRAARIFKICVPVTIGSLLNTALIVLCLIFFVPDIGFEGVTVYAYVPMMLISGAIELAVNNLVVPPLCMTVGKTLKRI